MTENKNSEAFSLQILKSKKRSSGFLEFLKKLEDEYDERKPLESKK